MSFLSHSVLVLVLFGLISQIKCEFKCNQLSLEKMDIAMSKALNVGKYHRKFPETYDEVGPFCDAEFEYIKEVEEYKTHCMKDLPKQLTSIIIYSVKQMIKSLCRKHSKRLTRLMSGAPCANKAQNEYSKCQYKYIDSLQGIVYEPEKRKIPHSCCEFYKFYDCMRSTAKKYDVCTEDRIEANVEYVGDIFNDMLMTLCGDWTDDSDKCSKLRSPMKKRKSDRRTASFLMPFIKVLDSFPEV